MDAIAHLAVDGIHWRCAYASWFGVSFNKHARTHMIQLSSRRQRSGSLKFRFPKSTICVFDYWIRFVPPSTSNESPRAHSAIKWQALLKTFNIITISKQVTFCVIDRRQQIVHQINKNLSKFIGIKIGHYKVYFMIVISVVQMSEERIPQGWIALETNQQLKSMQYLKQ